MLEYLHGAISFTLLKLDSQLWKVRSLRTNTSFRCTTNYSYAYIVRAGKVVTIDWCYYNNDEYAIAVVALEGGLGILTKNGEQYIYEYNKHLRPHYLPFSCFERAE